MNRNLRDEMSSRYDLINKMIGKLEDKICSLPEGKLKVKRNGNCTYYYLVGEDLHETLLNNNNLKLAEDLAQKNYLEKVVKESKQELAVLKRALNQYPEAVAEDVYHQLSDERKKLVKPIVPTDEQFIQRWQNKPFTHKKISDDVPMYLTMKGERVRSKSEVIISDRLNINGIPYKYECPLTFKRNGELITIHPDFTILRVSDRKTLYLEHNGRMDDPGYADDMVNRVNDYSYAGIVQGDNLFMTFETSETPLDISVLDKMIKNHFK